MAFSTYFGFYVLVCAVVCLLVHGKAVPSPDSRGTATHTADTSSTAVSETNLCTLTGRTYAQVYELKGLACQAMDDYCKESEYISGSCELIYPGANSVPICQYDQPEMWRKQLGYTAGVMRNLQEAGYVSAMCTYEKIINSSPVNTFTFVMEQMLNQTRLVNRMLADLTTSVPNVTLVDLVGQPNMCGSAPEEDAGDLQSWLPTQAEVESDDEYHYFLAVYNYGTMDAMCETLGQLHDSLQLTLNGTCARPEERLQATTVLPAVTTTGKEQ